MRRLLVLVVFAGLVGAACADDGTATTATTAAPSTPAGTTPAGSTPDTAPGPSVEIPSGPSPGVTDDTIKIGITYVDLVPVRDFVDLDHGDYEATYQAIIDDINAKGGINGRKLEAVMAGVSPLGAEDADATCVQFAQDEKVFAVVGFHYADTPLCYLELEKVAVIGGEMNEQRLARATVPWFSTEQSADLDLEALGTFAEQGLLDAPFAVYGTVNEPDLFDDTLAELDDLGYTPVADAILDADANDLNEQISKVQLIVENFKTAGAETVIVTGSGPVSWANGVEATTYRPFPADDERGQRRGRDQRCGQPRPHHPRRGDARRPLQPGPPVPGAPHAGVRRRDRAGGDRRARSGHAARLGREQPLRIRPHRLPGDGAFVAIAEAAGPDLDYGSFGYAGDHLGPVAIPGHPEPFTYGPPPSADGDPPVYLFEFDPATTSFVQVS
ncbi:MAG: hypothetical protein R2695_00595 [Acidimicrobiales bacterium]